MEGDYDTELCLGREAGHGRCTRQQSHQCECGKTFQFSWGLRDHIESEHEERDFSCPNCNKVFASAGNLSKHLGQRICLDRLPATPLETVEVVFDSTEVTQEPLLKRRKTEDGSKSQDNPCPHCGKIFLRPGNLVKHMEKQICLKSTQFLSPLAPNQTFITEDCFPNSKECSPSFGSFDEPPIFLVEEQPKIWGTYDIDEPSPVPATADIPCMTRAEEGLHCFWDEDTGFEVLLVQVESGGKLFWAEPLKEIDFLKEAAGNLVMPLEFEGLISREIPLESAVTSMEESFVEVIDEELAMWQEEGARAVKSLEGVSLNCLEQWDIPSLG